MIILLIIGFISIVLFEIPGLIVKKYWWEIIIFMSFLVIAFIQSIFLTLGFKIPNPTDGIINLVKFIIDIFS